MNSAQQLFSKMYEQQAGQQGAQGGYNAGPDMNGTYGAGPDMGGFGGQQGGQGGNGGDDDVIDADFRQV